ncbi:MAG TPA: T9SS type A sorting domain-containing protein [Cyclobacteriaceae bacterium]|nr:T9SS type A sorting domain-containing protein [Cyclobacteriaceae bacterium]
MRVYLLIGCLLVSGVLSAQNFELSGLQDSYRGSIGDLIRAPLLLKNTSDKPLTLIIRKVETQIGSTQKNYFCIDNNCLDQRTDDYIVKVEPGQTLQNLSIGLEAGLVEGFSAVKYVVFNKSNLSESRQFEINFIVEGRAEKSSIYSSRFITIHDVYPNPVTDRASIDYQLHNDEVKTKIVIHNILGNALTEYELPFSETKVKISADQLSAGIYFYTLYIDNEGVMTRKLIVKK